jgi:hypothetical protein
MSALDYVPMLCEQPAGCNMPKPITTLHHQSVHVATPTFDTRYCVAVVRRMPQLNGLTQLTAFIASNNLLSGSIGREWGRMGLRGAASYLELLPVAWR